jgi:hypothetical protein
VQLGSVLQVEAVSTHVCCCSSLTCQQGLRLCLPQNLSHLALVAPSLSPMAIATEHVMAALAETSRTRDSDAWSVSTKRKSSSSTTTIPSYYTSFITFKEATDSAVRLVTLEGMPKANIDSDVESSKGDQAASMPETWAPTKNEWLIMISLAFISLMVALDASILVTVLPVSRDTKSASHSAC